MVEHAVEPTVVQGVRVVNVKIVFTPDELEYILDMLGEYFAEDSKRFDADAKRLFNTMEVARDSIRIWERQGKGGI